MGYQVEEKETRECFTIKCKTGIEYIFAYTLEDAENICIERGLTIWRPLNK